MSLRRRLVPALAVAAVTSGTVAALPSHADTPSCQPARVAGLSYLLDAFQTGSSVGPGVIYGIVETVAGRPLPGPAGQAQNELLNAGASAVRTMSTEGPAQIQKLRSDIEFLAVWNAYSNAFIEMGAEQTDAVATEFSTAIQPFDATAHQMATIMRQTETAEAPCTTTSMSTYTGTSPVGRIGLAFVQGQGKRAAALIKKYGFAADSVQLGQAVYLGGIASVATKQYDEFSTAVSYALPHSGATVVTASQAFQAAAAKAVQSGLTATEGAVGGRTVMETYRAYATGS